MYINELTLLEPNLNKYDIRSILTNFIEVYVAYYKQTKCKELFLHSNYVLEFINSEHRIAMWLNDPEVDIEEKRLISSINQHIKYFDEIDNIEIKIDGKECKSAALVHLEESVLLSFITNKKWNKNELDGLYTYFDSDGKLISEIIKVPNVSIKEQLKIQSISEILTKNDLSLPMNYIELWTNREICFPNLIFCPSVEDNLKELEKSYYRQVLKKLIELENYFSKRNGSFNKNEILNVSPESESTLKEYKEEHEFFAPDGKKATASWHTRFTGLAGRIFFDPYFFKDNKCLICYIGKKLPNTSYPT